VKRAIDFFYATYPDEMINQILLSGGSSRLPGLDALLHRTQHPYCSVHPLARIDLDEKIFDRNT